MSNFTLATCPPGFVIQPQGFVQSLDFTQSHSICIAGCCVACPFQRTSSHHQHNLLNRDNVSLIHAALSDRRCHGLYIPSSHLSPPPLVPPYPREISSKHAKDLWHNRLGDFNLHQMFHHVSILLQDTLPGCVPRSHVP